MSVSRPGDIRVDAQVKLGEEVWTVIGVSDGRVHLAGAAGRRMSMPLPQLLTVPGFELVGASRAPLPPQGPLDLLPEAAATKARWWEDHILAVIEPGEESTGLSLRQREIAKVAELVAAGHEVRLNVFQRMRRRYETEGVWGLVDQRQARRGGAYTDQRVLEAIDQAIDEEKNRSTGTADRLRRRVVKILTEQSLDAEELMPSRATFYRLIERAAKGKHTFGSAQTRRSLAKRPDGPFGSVTATRPGEWMLIDSTPLDVLVLLDGGLVERVELTWVLDWATRSITASVLRPSTKAVDAALLLARTLTPEAMRPGWSDALRMRSSVLPHARLTAIDERLEHAAARPVVVPETIVVDHGKIYRSRAFDNACRAMGINVQPTHKGSPWEKGGVERSFDSLNSLFVQHIAGFTGRSVEHRGKTVEAEARWSIGELQDLLDEWVVAFWQNRPHDGLRHPDAPGIAMSPNEQYAHLVETAGYAPVHLGADDYIELLPAEWRVINTYGVKINHRRYDAAALNPYRGQHSGVEAKKGLWEVHFDPYDVSKVWVRNHHDGGWVAADWTHLGTSPVAFGDHAWEHAKRLLAEQGISRPAEAAIAEAVEDLLTRAEIGPARKPTDADKVAARTRATAPEPKPLSASEQLHDPPAPTEPDEDGDDEYLAEVVPLPVFDPYKESLKRW
nr:Mu transposase C-terminal domain-containing protein [Glycomyces arizonensis]